MLKQFLLILFPALTTTTARLDAAIATPTLPTASILTKRFGTTALKPAPGNLMPETSFRALHLRDGPAESAKVLGDLSNGHRVTDLQTGTWWKIQFKHLTGYANSGYLQKGCP